MKEQVKNIIWDWNGTLLNDVHLCHEIANVILKKEGLDEISELTYRNTFGFPISAYYQRIGIDLTKSSIDLLTKDFIHLYMSKVKECSLHDGIKNTLENLEAENKTQFILTAAHADMANEMLEYFGILPYFEAVFGLDNYNAESKVSKGIELFKTYNLSKESTVLIGDTLHDYEVATDLGIKCILISAGHQSKAVLEKGIKEDQVMVLDHAEQLRDYI